MSRSGCGVKRVVRCTGTGRGVGRKAGVEFGPASVCTRRAPQLHPLECRAFTGAASLGGIVSAGKRHSNQNWHGPGESDCLIKTKHCDGR
jgi:hypothetical protein